jgi:hypothetical protein
VIGQFEALRTASKMRGSQRFACGCSRKLAKDQK